MKLLNLFLERIVTVITHFKVTKLRNNQTKKTAHSFRQSTTEMERGGAFIRGRSNNRCLPNEPLTIKIIKKGK